MKTIPKAIRNLLNLKNVLTMKSKLTHQQEFAKAMLNKKMIITDEGLGRH